jgi:hypothetical protein
MSRNNDKVYEWRKLKDFVVGDAIRGQGHDMQVMCITPKGRLIRLLYCIDGKEEALVDAANAEYIAKKRESSTSAHHEHSKENKAKEEV